MNYTTNRTNGTTSTTYTPEVIASLMDEAPERPWEDLSLSEQQERMLNDFSPAQWLTDQGYLVGAVLRHDDRKWYAWKALAKERGVDTYGYEKGVDKLLQDLAMPRPGAGVSGDLKLHKYRQCENR